VALAFVREPTGERMSPHLQSLGTVLYPLLAATKAKTTSGSSSFSLIIIVVLFAGVYFLFIRPRNQKMRQQQQVGRQAEIGDEVILTSGIIGRVTWFEGARARIEIAPGIEVQIDKAAIMRKVPEVVSDDDVALRNEEHVADNPYGSNGNGTTAGSPPMVAPSAVAGGDERTSDAFADGEQLANGGYDADPATGDDAPEPSSKETS
jgi:preprotein translocase subunit YajC